MKLATPTFLTGPEDNLAVADVYGVSSEEVINNLAGTVSSFASDSVSKIRNDLGIEESLGSILNDVEAGKLGPTEIQARLEDVVAQAGTNINNLTESLKDSALNSIAESAGVDGEQLKYYVDGTTRLVRGDYSQAEPLLRGLGEMMGDAELFKAVNLGAESAMLSAYLEEAINLGIPHIVEALEQKASDPSVISNIAERNLLTAIKKSDLGMVEKLVDKVGVGKTLAKYPNLDTLILEHYAYPEDGVLEYDVEYNDLVALLLKLKPDWPTVEGVSGMTNLVPFRKASDDALDLLTNRTTDTTYLTEALIAGSYDSQPFNEMAKAAFPSIGL